MLTAYANGGRSHAELHLDLRTFQEQSDRLRREVISVIAYHRPEVLCIALEQAKKKNLPDDGIPLHENLRGGEV